MRRDETRQTFQTTSAARRRTHLVCVFGEVGSCKDVERAVKVGATGAQQVWGNISRHLPAPPVSTHTHTHTTTARLHVGSNRLVEDSVSPQLAVWWTPHHAPLSRSQSQISALGSRSSCPSSTCRKRDDRQLRPPLQSAAVLVAHNQLSPGICGRTGPALIPNRPRTYGNYQDAARYR